MLVHRCRTKKKEVEPKMEKKLRDVAVDVYTFWYLVSWLTQHFHMDSRHFISSFRSNRKLLWFTRSRSTSGFMSSGHTLRGSSACADTMLFLCCWLTCVVQLTILVNLVGSFVTHIFWNLNDKLRNCKMSILFQVGILCGSSRYI